MGELICGLRRYKIADIPRNTEYRITPPSKIRKYVELEMMQDFADILIRGYQLLNGKSPPQKANAKAIKYDVVDKQDIHDKDAQKQYLKETRKIWEERFSFPELLWMVDFGYLIPEIGGSVSDNWYVMYQIIRGELPGDFPSVVCFSIMIENILDWKSEKYINKTVKEYLKNNPASRELLQSGKIPDNLELYPEIGLIMEEYVRYAKERVHADGE